MKFNKIWIVFAFTPLACPSIPDYVQESQSQLHNMLVLRPWLNYYFISSILPTSGEAVANPS